MMQGDTLGLMETAGPARGLLETVMEDGRRLPAERASLADARARCQSQLFALPEGVRALREPAEYPVTLSAELEQLLTQTTPES